MRFTFPHLHSNKFSGLFNYKLSFQLGKPEGFCFDQRTERADPIGGWEAGGKLCQAHLVLHLYLLHCLWPSPRSSPRPISRVLGFSVWLMFPPQGFKGAPVASEVRACLWMSALAFLCGVQGSRGGMKWEQWNLQDKRQGGALA